MSGREESMPRKSRDSRVSRWQTHQEAKEDRARGRSTSKQTWKEKAKEELEEQEETKMTKEQMQKWIGLNCKFAAIDKFATTLVANIVESKVPVTGEAFSKIIQAVLKEEIARLNPDIRQRLMKALMNISKQKGNLTAIDMMSELKGSGMNPGLLSVFKLPRQTLMDEDIKPLINEVLQVNRLSNPKAPHTKETRDIDWAAAKEQETLNLTPRVPAKPAPRVPSVPPRI